MSHSFDLSRDVFPRLEFFSKTTFYLSVMVVLKTLPLRNMEVLIRVLCETNLTVQSFIDLSRSHGVQ